KLRTVLDSVAPLKQKKVLAKQKAPWRNKEMIKLKRSCKRSEHTWRKTKLQVHLGIFGMCGITMGQLAEGCGVPVDVWPPHHKMVAICTTSPRMQQDPTRCRCLRHLIEGAFKTGGACCEGASYESRESQEGEKRALDVRVKSWWKRLLKRLLSRIRKGEGSPQAGKDLDGQTLSLQPQLVGLKLGATL